MSDGMRGSKGGAPAPPLHYAWIVVMALVLALMAGAGMRSSFGVFIKPLEQEFGWDRKALSLAAAIGLFLYGAVGPLAGRLADRLGPRPVLGWSLLILGVGAVASAAVTQLWQLVLTAGVFTAVGAGGAAISTASAVASRWFETRRGLVIGIAGAAMSAGQLLLIPLSMAVTVHYGWRMGFVTLGLLVLGIVFPVAVWLIRNDPADVGLSPYGASERDPAAASVSVGRGVERTSLREATRTGSFWLLAGSFFVCGYTSSGLIITHLIPHSIEHGFSEMAAAQALGIMGAMNVVGTILSGYICDRFGRKGPLAFYYFVRGLSLLFLIGVATVPSLHLFAAIFGLNYISTVPPTSTLTARIFGRYSVGELFGWIFLSHQVGAALGSYLGGVVFDLTGEYSLAFLSAAILAFIASGLALSIHDAPARTTPTPSTESPAPVPSAY